MKYLKLGKKIPATLLSVISMGCGNIASSAIAMESDKDLMQLFNMMEKDNGGFDTVAVAMNQTTPVEFAEEILEKKDGMDILTVGDHKLEIYDKTGKFSISHEKPTWVRMIDEQGILFCPKFEGNHIESLGSNIHSSNDENELNRIDADDEINEEQINILKMVDEFFGTINKLIFENSTQIHVDDIGESVFQIMETDTRPETEMIYFVKKHPDFDAYFEKIVAYNQKSQSKYIWLSYKPDSTFFTESTVKGALKNNFHKFLKQDSLNVKENSILRAFYNRHGIILNTYKLPLSLNLLCQDTPELTTKKEQNPLKDKYGELIQMNPSNKKIKSVEIQYDFFPEEKLIFCQSKGLQPKFSLIVGTDVAFLNGEPANIIEATTLLELWEGL